MMRRNCEGFSLFRSSSIADSIMAALARLKNRAWRLRRYPEGLPVLDDFELFDNTSEAPATLDCGHVLLKTAFISVDPYMRTRMKPGYVYLLLCSLFKSMVEHVGQFSQC